MGFCIEIIIVVGAFGSALFFTLSSFSFTSAPVQERRNYVGHTKIKSDFLLLFPQNIVISYMGDITSFRMFE